MGNSLIAMSIRNESLMHEALCVRRQGKVVRLAEAGIASSDRERVRREHPDAFWVVEVPITAVWDGIDEPRGDSRWYRDPEKLAAHRERVRLSLETFVNGALEGLDEMLRTGWFIIRRARATITELVEVPDGGKVGE
ncbi:MAG: hypothetical protein IPM35_28000 [Myxococcales bacterium]|nr:hypothetical protein [Myxococcales bacterium]